MSKNTWLFLVLSAVFGLGAVYLANNWLTDSSSLPDENYIQVVEVAQTVPIGSVIEAQQLRVRAYPEALAPEGTFATIESVTGQVARETLYAGDVVRAARVTEKGEGSSLASLIGDNMRALTIRVNDVVGVAGFLLPGDRVDILNTFKNGINTLTEVVLANVKILAIDQTAQNNENRPRVVRAVTVEVSLQQAEELMNARSRGGLQLALRNPVDDEQVEIAKYTKPAPPAEEPAPVKKPVHTAVPHPVKPKVRLIRGVIEEVVSVESASSGSSE
ncbi:Flp pilus assembly protein CpaB [Alteromonas sp. ASW11-19]|uniref:Flp pilus assembly protein CpaB n=1 Tax=Alteromonas salexigens TaxID=2982530 RepID=A0ABT2VRM6_9ALTE|nr:Flp pilus assembly protein CpaB [Alteromonas salexigens]MCU7554876.1 Flp pilus assembly protein CpaB [Alteromonas salexigens]